MALTFEYWRTGSTIGGGTSGPSMEYWRAGTVFHLFEVAATGISGVLSVTEAADTLSATGALAITGVLSATEAADTLAATGALAIAGVVAITEAGDTLVATGELLLGFVDCPHARIRLRAIPLLGMRSMPGLPLHSPIGFGWFEYV